MNLINLLTQVDSFTKANGMGTISVVDSSSSECRTHRSSGQRRRDADIRFRHNDHCCQVSAWLVHCSCNCNQLKLCYCSVHSLLAAFGLVENSMILLVSSMLISPLMGPIIATIFGIVIEDRALIRFGWANEMFGVLLATTVGFFFGLIIFSLDLYSHGIENGLATEEMLSRLVAIVLAQISATDWIIFFSSQMRNAFACCGHFNGTAIGCGGCNRYTWRECRFAGWSCHFCIDIAASGQYSNFETILDFKNSNSIHKLQFQGIFWSMSVLHFFDMIEHQTMIKSNYYSDHQTIELAVHGALSMLLTAANIACILLMGVLVLKVCSKYPFL